jgi:transcription elongation factor Elf1
MELTTADLPLVEQPITCPFCGESITVLLDLSAGGQAYVEDCQVCCRPMDISFDVDEEGRVNVSAEHAG